MSLEHFRSTRGIHLNPNRSAHGQVEESKASGELTQVHFDHGVTVDVTPESIRDSNRLVTAECDVSGVVIGISTLETGRKVDLFGLNNVFEGSDMMFPRRKNEIILLPRQENPFYLLAGSPPLLFLVITSFEAMGASLPQDQFTRLGFL